MHDDRRLVEQRIRRQVVERLTPLVYPESEVLQVAAGPTLGDLAPIAVGDKWGPPWTTTWFELTGKLPDAWRGRRVEAIIDLGFEVDAPGFQCEGLVIDANGRAVQGVHPRRQAVRLDSSGSHVRIVVEAASNPAFPQFRSSPMGSPDTAPDFPLYRLRRADAVLVDETAESLLYDFDVLDATMRVLDERDPRRAQLLDALVRALDRLPDLAAATAVLAPVLAMGARASAHHIVACGHAHIDTAWLWPIRETMRKCRRTFASAVALMDERPDYRFACSQAQQYAWIEQQDPDLFERIAAKVRSGQWLPVGGMWVEADMNLPSGESLVRQLVQGQRYFESRFGMRCKEAWIPDVFGYPAGLPQLFRAAGIDRFVTQKLSWNKTNRFPHHTFWWEGLDGSRVLTHFPPVDTYNAEITAEQLDFAARNFSDHRWSRWSLMPFGYGDGGGGPTREMIERARRLADLDGMPALRIGSPSEFFDHVEAEIRAGAQTPVWRGELYFEMHRGTLTSQLGTKLGNRRCERLLVETELWSAALGRHAGIDELWRQVLTQQFHDILPGSSIAWVHADAEAVFQSVATDVEARISGLLGELAAPLGGGAAVANPSSRARHEVIETGAEIAGDGPRQDLDDGRTAAVVDVAAFAVAPLRAVDTRDRVVVTDRSMSNHQLSIRWDPDGSITSIIDPARGRELIPAGALAAVLELAPDHPVEYDAWDLESWTRKGAVTLHDAERVEVVESGPLVGRVRVRRTFGASTADVTYTLRTGSPRLDIDIDLDWNHDEHLLSMAFPIDVRTDTAICDVQFGVVERPTHSSTSWDAAKFEVCAHRFVALAEPHFGVAVLNDGRYGHAVFDGAIRVSLARAPKYPDPGADHGRHRVTLSVMPYGGDLADVLSEADLLNRPLRIVDAAEASEAEHECDGYVTVSLPPVELLGAGIDVDAVKLADDGSGDLIVRFHEACGDRVPVTVRTPRRITGASRCNVLEEPSHGYEVSDGIVALVLAPFELITLRIAQVTA
ncbi:MAG: glycosyl hydrolase-related protein [Actinomycetota bacterium]|nr:glycosyl hydrolase-related protein [Actinomycetota bacterium]